MCSTGSAQSLRADERTGDPVEPHRDGYTDPRTAAGRTVRSAQTGFGSVGSIRTRISIAARSSVNG
jgi:hypothetical protein